MQRSLSLAPLRQASPATSPERGGISLFVAFVTSCAKIILRRKCSDAEFDSHEATKNTKKAGTNCRINPFLASWRSWREPSPAPKTRNNANLSHAKTAKTPRSCSPRHHPPHHLRLCLNHLEIGAHGGRGHVAGDFILAQVGDGNAVGACELLLCQAEFMPQNSEPPAHMRALQSRDTYITVFGIIRIRRDRYHSLFVHLHCSVLPKSS